MDTTPVQPHARRRWLIASLTAAFVLGTMALQAASPASAGPATTAVAGAAATTTAKTPTRQELDQADRVPMSEVIAKAVPSRPPTFTRPLPGRLDAPEVEGPTQRFDGAAPRAGSTPDAGGPTDPAGLAAAQVTGSVWPGGYNRNPNRQIGKLYYDTLPGPRVSWNVCSGTAINTANKSLVMTAGHCVYNSDPDGNGRVDGNGYYYEDFRFCPGFESTCKLGVWYYRLGDTTPSWYHGVGAARTYDWSDDVAVLVMKRNPSGYLVNVVGGQGITFNEPVNQVRTAMGYPAPDPRFPYYYNGLDLIYCQGTDSLAASRTKVWLPCRMTGGSSGGPWLSWVNNSWLGYVNSVNSHKPYGAEYMEGPYFGGAEANLFRRYRSA
ncbi:MAG TPA: hypothetical protein VFR07_12600 [Mycobacteriales bacterium]|jgi:hypothetical protein|nr:hypothetical protein [Mycobacteriales bacterium]